MINNLWDCAAVKFHDILTWIFRDIFSNALGIPSVFPLTVWAQKTKQLLTEKKRANTAKNSDNFYIAIINFC